MFPGSEIVYNSMYLIGFALMMVINLRTYKRYKLSLSNTIVITLITYGVGVLGAFTAGKTYAAILTANNFPTEGTVAIFGAVIFTPLLMSLAAIALKQSWKKILDLLAPGIFVILASAKLGCGLHGCCYGRPCETGIYNPYAETTVVPIQFIEVFFMLLIIGFCFWYGLKSKQYVEGTVYPITATLYCIMRFVTEFFRNYDHEEMRHLAFGVTVWQFCCLAVSLISVVWIAVLFVKNKKKTEDAAA